MQLLHKIPAVIRLTAIACVVAGTGCVSIHPPIEVGSIERTIADGPIRGYWARVRLDHPAVEIRVTAPLPAGESFPPGTEAILTPVSAWGGAGRATLAINANFFAKVLQPAEGKPDPGWIDSLPVDLVGLSISDGRVVSPPRLVQGHGDPALLFLRNGRARIDYTDRTDLPGLVCAVAGIGPTDDGRQAGTFLVTAGRNTGATARVAPALRHPRTAAGVSADGRTLILAVVDGRQKGYSVGVTLPELADLMIELGAANAVNLDGGGSSSFIYHSTDGAEITNRPSDGHWRPVGNHLGVWLRRR